MQTDPAALWTTSWTAVEGPTDPSSNWVGVASTGVVMIAKDHPSANMIHPIEVFGRRIMRSPPTAANGMNRYSPYALRAPTAAPAANRARMTRRAT